MTDILKFSVPGKPEYVSVVRMALSTVASNIGFNVEDIDDIKVAVSEACSNVVRHGNCECESYNVTCEIEKESLTILVDDCGCGYDVDKYKNPNPDEPKEGGMGIYIIKALMDEVEILSEIGMGTKIKMIKKLNY